MKSIRQALKVSPAWVVTAGLALLLVFLWGGSSTCPGGGRGR